MFTTQLLEEEYQNYKRQCFGQMEQTTFKWFKLYLKEWRDYDLLKCLSQKLFDSFE